jgi:hypothetical protein
MALEAEEVSCNLVILSNNDLGKDNASNDDKTEEDLFFWDARYIQNRTSQSVRTAAIEDCCFRGLFGARINIVLKVWGMLGEGGLCPEKSKLKNLLWTL